MYQVSTALAAALASQRLYMRVSCGDTALNADRVTNCSYSASCGGGDSMSIGGVTAAAVTLTIKERVELLNQTIAVEVGALVSETVQYIPLGTFTITECQQGEDHTSVTGYDAVYCCMGIDYVPTAVSGATVAAVLEDIAGQCGLTLAELPAAASTTVVTGDLTGHTCREMAGFVAALVGCNVLINRESKLVLRWFTDSGYAATADDYYDGGLALNGADTLACIACTVTTKTTTTEEDGTASESEESQTLSAGGTGSGISFENPYMTQSVLDAVWASIGGLSYETGSCNLVGGLLLEPGDFITVTDVSGVSHTIPVMSLALTIDGGCRATVSATGESSTNSAANFTGSLSGAIQQVVADVAKIKNLSAENIAAVKAKIENLYADQAFVNSLFAQDITATGTISGLKLRGESIDISSEYVYDVTWSDPDGTSMYMGQEAASSVLKTGFEIEGAAGNNYLNYWTQIKNTYTKVNGDIYTAEIMMEAGGVRITGNGLTFQSETPIVVRAPCETDTYTEFDGGVVTEGNVTVAVKMGWCLVHGRIRLNGTVSDLITVLDSSKVPAPQTGISIGTTAGYWTSSYTRLMRVVVGAGGGLRIMYGAAGLYDFAISYPVGESYTGDTSTTGRAGSAIVDTATAA